MRPRGVPSPRAVARGPRWPGDLRRSLHRPARGDEEHGPEQPAPVVEARRTFANATGRAGRSRRAGRRAARRGLPSPPPPACGSAPAGTGRRRPGAWTRGEGEMWSFAPGLRARATRPIPRPHPRGRAPPRTLAPPPRNRPPTARRRRRSRRWSRAAGRRGGDAPARARGRPARARRLPPGRRRASRSEAASWICSQITSALVQPARSSAEGSGIGVAIVSGVALRIAAHGVRSGGEDRDESQYPVGGLVNPGSARPGILRGRGAGRAARSARCAVPPNVRWMDGAKGNTGAMGDLLAHAARFANTGVAESRASRERGLPDRVGPKVRHDSRGQDARAPRKTAAPNRVSRPFTRTLSVPDGRAWRMRR